MNKDLLYYVASPYSSPCPMTKQIRYLETLYLGSLLVKDGFLTVEPIAMNHQQAERFGLPDDANYWEDRNFKLLSVCDALIILLIDGWETSKGLKAEIEEAKRLGLPVYCCDLDDSEMLDLYPVTSQ